jgi:plastocyanin
VNEIAIGATIHDFGISGAPRDEFDEYQFSPNRTKVPVGTKMTWINTGKIPHGVTASDESWSTGELAPGQSGTVTFSKPGRYTYIDKLHPFMSGEIIVE